MKVQTIENIYKIVHECFVFDPPWNFAFGDMPSSGGIWIIWGKEKNGKTTFALILAKYLSGRNKVICDLENRVIRELSVTIRVLYLSAEEGLEKDFVLVMKRAGLQPNSKNIHFLEYEPLESIIKRLEKRNAPDIVVFDNITVYKDELKAGALQDLKNRFPYKLFIFLAHEERKEPATAQAKLCKKLAKVIVHVVGLKAMVSGRVVGGEYMINEEKAELYWGANTINDEQD